MNSHKAALSDEPKPHQSVQDTSSVWASTKLQAHHRDRLAIVYVRQSTAQQVLENKKCNRSPVARIQENSDSNPDYSTNKIFHHRDLARPSRNDQRQWQNNLGQKNKDI